MEITVPVWAFWFAASGWLFLAIGAVYSLTKSESIGQSLNGIGCGLISIAFMVIGLTNFPG